MLFQEFKMDGIWLSEQVGPSSHIKVCSDSQWHKVSSLQWVKSRAVIHDAIQGTPLSKGGARV